MLSPQEFQQRREERGLEIANNSRNQISMRARATRWGYRKTFVRLFMKARLILVMKRAVPEVCRERP